MLTVLLQITSGGGIMDFMPLILIVVVMYFFMIRPQVKKQKSEAKFRSEISKGDKVITVGGIHAKVLEVNEDTLLIQADGGSSKFKINKASIAKV
jgi:preprotein translocase subunit YajC